MVTCDLMRFWRRASSMLVCASRALEWDISRPMNWWQWCCWSVVLVTSSFVDALLSTGMDLDAIWMSTRPSPQPTSYTEWQERLKSCKHERGAANKMQSATRKITYDNLILPTSSASSWAKERAVSMADGGVLHSVFRGASIARTQRDVWGGLVWVRWWQRVSRHILRQKMAPWCDGWIFFYYLSQTPRLILHGNEM